MKDCPDAKRAGGKGNRYSKTNKPQQPQQQSFQNSRKQQVCYRCGGHHNPSDCPFKQYQCHNCMKKGHLVKVCRKMKSSSSPSPDRARPDRAHYIEEGESEKQRVGKEYGMYHVDAGQAKPLYATITVNSNPFAMEVDTGASVSITSQETFKAIQNGESTLQLEESSVKLQTYTGEPIPICGSTQVQVVHNEQVLSLPLVVTQGKGPTLLGRNWLEALRLDWRTIFTIGTAEPCNQFSSSTASCSRTNWGSFKESRPRSTSRKALVRDLRRPDLSHLPSVRRLRRNLTDSKH